MLVRASCCAFALWVCGTAGAGREAGEPEAPLLIFVSFSLPEAALRRLARDARRTGAILVLRGLAEESLPRTAARLGELLQGQLPETGHPAAPDGPVLVIDPTAYRRFGVAAVPTFVLCLEPLPACRTAICTAPPHVRLAGDVSLEYVLERLAAVPAARARAEFLRSRLRDGRP